MKKQKDTFIEVTPDGKQEIEEGKEPLNKPGKEYPVDAAQSNYQDEQNEKKRKEVEKTDKLKGGLADNSSPSDFDKKQLEMGIKIEMEEHTKDKSIAREIAMDHLKEFPDYYTRLNNMEDKAEKEIKKSINDRWKLLKGNLKNKDAFMDIDIEGDDESEDSDSGESGDDSQELIEAMKDSGQQDESNPEDLEAEPEDDTATELGDEETQNEEEPEESEEIPEDVVEEAGGEEEAEKLSEEELKSMMEEMGYSPEEITHVIHGHGVSFDPDEARKDEAHEQDMDIKNNESMVQQGTAEETIDHAKNTNSKDLERISELNEIEVEHERRMKELDYTMARRAREMELKYKEKELEQKLRNAEKDAKVKRDQKKDQHSKKVKENGNKHERQLVDNVVN